MRYLKLCFIKQWANSLDIYSMNLYYNELFFSNKKISNSQISTVQELENKAINLKY